MRSEKPRNQIRRIIKEFFKKLLGQQSIQKESKSFEISEQEKTETARRSFRDSNKSNGIHGRRRSYRSRSTGREALQQLATQSA